MAAKLAWGLCLHGKTLCCGEVGQQVGPIEGCGLAEHGFRILNSLWAYVLYWELPPGIILIVPGSQEALRKP